MRALILDSWGTRAALSGARALAAAGWHVGLALPAGTGCPATASRRVRATHVVPAPGCTGARLKDALQRAIGDEGYEVVFAATDADLLALSALREQLPVVVPHPRHASVLRALDKAQLAAAAQSAGVPAPRTTSPDDAESLRFPALVKERLHGDIRTATSSAPADAQVVASPAEARDGARRLRAHGRDAVVQEVVDGRLVALTVVCDHDARPVARVQQEALRTWPAPVGRSVRARTVAVDVELAAGVGRLLAELEWFGLAQLQFIAPSDGPPQLIDLNARFYGSLPLALAAGVNLPATWAALATGREAPRTPRDAPAGARYQWLASDLRQARQDRRGGSVWTDALGCLVWGLGARHSTWAVSDPRPAAHALGALARRRLR